MFKFKFREQLLQKEARVGRRIPLREVSEATGISMQVLSSLASPTRQIVTNTAFIEAICRYLECEIQEFLELDPPLDQSPACHVEELYPNRKR